MAKIKMKIKAKLIAAFLFMLLIVGFIGLMGTLQAEKIQSNAVEINKHWMQKNMLLYELTEISANYRIYLVQYVFSGYRGDHANRSLYEPKINVLIKEFDKNLSNLKKLGLSDTDRKLYATIQKDWDSLKMIDTKLITKVKNNNYRKR